MAENPDRKRPELRLYAHRGAAAELPENTLPSFQRALECGATALEMDLHRTSDGHVVVSHDPTGTRMCGVDREIRKTPLHELREWDAGHGFVDESGERCFAGKGFRIPTLEAVLGEFPDVQLNVDVKQPRPSMVREVLDLVERLGCFERVTLASFRLGTILEVRRSGYPGPTGMPSAEVATLLATPAPVFRLLPRTGTSVQVPVRAGPLDLSRRSFIDKCHGLGLRVDYWTINDPGEATRLLECGADGIMTDDPRRIAPRFAAFRERSGDTRSWRPCPSG